LLKDYKLSQANPEKQADYIIYANNPILIAALKELTKLLF